MAYRRSMSHTLTRAPRAAALALLGMTGVMLLVRLGGTQPMHRSTSAAASVAVPAPRYHAQEPDTTCKPCQDFYRFVNHAWLDSVTIPPTASIVGPAYVALDRTLHRVNTILTEAADKRNTTGTIQQIGAFYASCMDSARAEKDGVQPLAGALAEIDAVSTPADVAVAAAKLQRIGVPVLFGVNVGLDQKNSPRLILTISQGGLGLPDRDYYLKPDSATASVRASYDDYIKAISRLAGAGGDAAAAASSSVMRIETALAKASMTNVARRDPVATYHKLGVAQLRALAPVLPWDRIVEAWNAHAPDSILVRQPQFLTALGTELQTVPVADWRAYLRWHLLSAASPNLSSAFAKESFRFTRHFSGMTQELPRWQRCTNSANSIIGELVGRAYVAQLFPPAYKEKMKELVENERAVLIDRIRALDWMSETTKREALAKVKAMHVQVGYPDKWKDYSSLVLDRGPFVRNVRRARQFDFDRQMARIGQLHDTREWQSGVPQVFDGLAGQPNTITFTAAALQPPWFDPKGDDAANYGSLGTVIGHEMSHHFDDTGHRFDANGNLRDWWTADDAKRYNERAQKVVEQFNGYTILDTLHLKGQFLLGENLADLGGVKIAYLALEKSLSGKPRPPVGGYTPEQRFFIGLARGWASKSRPEYLRQRFATNGHAPDQYRVNGPLSNMPEFARAFGCKAGDPMVRPPNLSAEIW
jgi:putative endopeptidase